MDLAFDTLFVGFFLGFGIAFGFNVYSWVEQIIYSLTHK